MKILQKFCRVHTCQKGDGDFGFVFIIFGLAVLGSAILLIQSWIKGIKNTRHGIVAYYGEEDLAGNGEEAPKKFGSYRVKY